MQSPRQSLLATTINNHSGTFGIMKQLGHASGVSSCSSLYSLWHSMYTCTYVLYAADVSRNRDVGTIDDHRHSIPHFARNSTALNFTSLPTTLVRVVRCYDFGFFDYLPGQYPIIQSGLSSICSTPHHCCCFFSFKVMIFPSTPSSFFLPAQNPRTWKIVSVQSQQG